MVNVMLSFSQIVPPPLRVASGSSKNITGVPCDTSKQRSVNNTFPLPLSSPATAEM